MIWRNEAFRHVPWEVLITDRERQHIERILSHSLETDEDLLALAELTDREAPADTRKDHGLQP